MYDSIYHALPGASADICDGCGGPTHRDILYFTRPLPGRLYAAFCRNCPPTVAELDRLRRSRERQE